MSFDEWRKKVEGMFIGGHPDLETDPEGVAYFKQKLHDSLRARPMVGERRMFVIDVGSVAPESAEKVIQDIKQQMEAKLKELLVGRDLGTPALDRAFAQQMAVDNEARIKRAQDMRAERRKRDGLCPKCGCEGEFRMMALVCPEHGAYAGC